MRMGKERNASKEVNEKRKGSRGYFQIRLMN